MGHQSYCGRVTEQAIGGTSFVRIDVPELKYPNGSINPAFTKLFGAAAIYCITPVSEETARLRMQQNRSFPMNTWDIQSLLSSSRKLKELPMHGEGDDDMDDDDELGEEVD